MELTMRAEAGDVQPTVELPRMLNKHTLRARLAPEMTVRQFDKWLHKATSDGTFPGALRFGQRNRRWREDEVLAWLERRPRACAEHVQDSLRKAALARKAKARA